MGISILQPAAAAVNLSDTAALVIAAANAAGIGAQASRYDHAHALNDSGWMTPTLLNGWVIYDATYGNAAMYRKIGNIVFARGLVKNGTVGAAIFNFPAGYRPSIRMLFACETNPNVNCRVDVDPNGNINGSGESNGWLSLGNVIFVADG